MSESYFAERYRDLRSETKPFTELPFETLLRSRIEGERTPWFRLLVAAYGPYLTRVAIGWVVVALILVAFLALRTLAPATSHVLTGVRDALLPGSSGDTTGVPYLSYVPVAVLFLFLWLFFQLVVRPRYSALPREVEKHSEGRALDLAIAAALRVIRDRGPNDWIPTRDIPPWVLESIELAAEAAVVSLYEQLHRVPPDEDDHASVLISSRVRDDALETADRDVRAVLQERKEEWEVRWKRGWRRRVGTLRTDLRGLQTKPTPVWRRIILSLRRRWRIRR